MQHRIASVLAFLALSALPAAAQTLLGPTPYLSAADSPFPVNTPSFVLEDFEDGLLNVPGVSAVAGYVTSTHFTGAIIDSVDGDDGVINGACANGDSFFNAGNVRFQFDAQTLGGLPTSVGIVWTDGGPGCTVTFEAFDANAVSLGIATAPSLGDGSNTGTTAEDRFFGIVFAGGIHEIKVTNSTGGIEVDHLQYNLPCASLSSTYCTAKTNSLGCAPSIGSAGCASATSPSAYSIVCTQVVSNKSGLLFYGLAPASTPFQGGTLCVQAPTVRTPIQTSGGSPPPDTCTGHYTFDMNAWIRSGADSNLTTGTTVYAQYWYRDPPVASTTGLSNGLSFTVGP